MRRNNRIAVRPPHTAANVGRRTVVRLATGILASIAFFHSPMPSAFADDGRSSEDVARAPLSPEFETRLIRGHVVWFVAALQRRLGIRSVPEAAETVLALETTDGRLIPLIEDVRTRAFRRDKRMRDMQVELRVRNYRDTPAMQILTVYEILDGKKFEVDYWCDICSIPMYESGPCACCQEDNRLRKRGVATNP